MTDQAEEIDRFLGKLVSDRYRIQRKIGEGGMGTVYEAVHEAIEKKIALKILHARYSASPEVVSRFKQEAISASRIKHQNVIDVFDFGQLGDGSCFIAMEYLEGLDLGAALEQRRKFSPDEAIRITVQMCRALGLGHGRGVVHRDLKPENVFLQVTPEGEEIVKIVDFGIAQLRGEEDSLEQEEQERRRRLTKTGMIFGTPEYMAPEQARGAAIDQRSDIYATGVILYELLTGAVPFMGESFLEVLNQHVQSVVPSFATVNPGSEVSEELEQVVLRALAKDPDDRFASMKDFAAALLRTPEGRKARTRISSLSDEEGAEERRDALLENSNYPKAQPGAETAMFGSAGEPSEPPEDIPSIVPTKSSKGLVAALLLILGAAGAGGYLFLGVPSADTAAVDRGEASDPAVHLERPKAASASSPEEEEREEDTVTDAPDAGKVTLKVTTIPEGAVVKKDGFQVCDATPCDVVVEQGEAATFTAEVSADNGTMLQGEAKVLAQRDQSVLINLSARKPVAPAPRKAPRPVAKPNPKPALCEVMVDGIKILRPCE